MSSSRFVEGDLVFDFPAEWGVRKYDEQRFYRHMGGMGLKAVDFVAIDPEEEGHLYLIEVKNYRTRYRDDLIFEAPLLTQKELAEIIATKYEHTLRAIRAIHLFYQRKWWYRPISPALKNSRRWAFDLVFWTHAHRLSEKKQSHTLLFWLETEESSLHYRHYLEQELRNLLPAEVNITITHQDGKNRVGIEVTENKKDYPDR